MWSKEEAPFIRSLLEFSSNVAEAAYHDVVTDSDLCFTSGWENVRPRAIYQSNRHSGRRKVKASSSSATRTRRDVNSKSSKSTHVMRGTLDDSWNYHYPTAKSTGSVVAARDDKIQEITEDVVKETSSNNPWEQEVHVQKLRDAIAALVKKDHLPLQAREQVGVSTHPGDKPPYRWAVEKPNISMVQLKDKERRVTTIPHQMHKISLAANDSQLLKVRQLPVATWRTNHHQMVSRHKVLDPTIRYELSQLVQSQLYGQLLVEQQNINDQLLKVSSALLLPSSSAAAQHNELQGSRSYPNITTTRSFNNTSAPLHKLSSPKRF